MRTLFWILALIALVAALTLAASHSEGYVLLVLPPYRAELSFNFAVILLIVAFVLLYVVARFISTALGLPARVGAWRAVRRRQRGRATLLDAVRAFFAGHYGQAEKAAARAIEMGEAPALSAVVAARAAHELRAPDRRDAYLARAAVLAPEDDAVRNVAEAELLLDERRVEEARAVLKKLPRKHTAALRLELAAEELAGNWEAVLALLPPLEKQRALDQDEVQTIRRRAQVRLIERESGDAERLRAAWKRLPPKARTHGRVAAAAAKGFAALGACGEAQRIIEQSLNATWDSDLAALYADCEDGGDALKRIERAERWLKAHPDDAGLLLALGRLCSQQGLWGKAQSYIEASIAIAPTHAAHLAAARLNEHVGNPEAARDHYRQGLQAALERLERVRRGNEERPTAGTALVVVP
jgi:HemY protein